MKLKKIGEIATKKVPLWQPMLLVIILLLGGVIATVVTKTTQPQQKKAPSGGTTLGATTVTDKLVSGVTDLAGSVSQTVQKDAQTALGSLQQSLQQTVQDVASKSTTQAKAFVFDNTLGKLLQNINTLPADQQELIKKAICK